MTHYILVADAARARIIGSDDAFEEAEEIEDFVHPSGRARARDLVTDQNTTSTSIPTGPRSQIEPSDPQEVETRRFAQMLAERLHRARAAGAFQSLVLVAPPKFLGLLREELDAPTARLVVGSVDKDLTRESLRDTLAALRRDLATATR